MLNNNVYAIVSCYNYDQRLEIMNQRIDRYAHNFAAGALICVNVGANAPKIGEHTKYECECPSGVWPHKTFTLLFVA